MGSASTTTSAIHAAAPGANGGVFSLRKDRTGYRPVFPLGNNLGRCPYDCAFCAIKATDVVGPDEAGARFDRLLATYHTHIDGPYHPLIYNQGNVTNEREFSRQLLDEILERFRTDERVQYVSLNSRERDATPEVLAYLAQKDLPYPIHFIFGAESFSKRASHVFGKETSGELDRFVAKLRDHNAEGPSDRAGRPYAFGLDVSLVFLPELYLAPGADRSANGAAIAGGVEADVVCLLDAIGSDVPFEINLHPYCRVDALPYLDAGLELLVPAFPVLQRHIARHNADRARRPSHVFVGIEGPGYSSEFWRRQRAEWGPFLRRFNERGAVD